MFCFLLLLLQDTMMALVIYMVLDNVIAPIRARSILKTLLFKALGSMRDEVQNDFFDLACKHFVLSRSLTLVADTVCICSLRLPGSDRTCRM